MTPGVFPISSSSSRRICQFAPERCSVQGKYKGMADVFVPQGYASKTFWPVDDVLERTAKLPESAMLEIQPFSVYQLDHPHVIRKRVGHYGAMPRCRASATESLDLVRKVLQPAINHDIVEVLKRYITVFRDAAENISANMKNEHFASCATEEELNVDNMVHKACCDALDHCKTLFVDKKVVKPKSDAPKTQVTVPGAKPSPLAASSLSNRLVMKRVPSPDFPWTKRLAGKGSPRRSLSPTPRPAKRGRPTPRRYGSPLQGREPLSRENWDPEKLTTETGFVMGTKANKALGLGATRGRIYMKHPELFKYSSDPEDKKWMVQNNCMLATGGKNTFILIADDIYDLMDNEYKESPHLQPEEMQVFKLPEFILQKMRTLMLKEKKLTQKLMQKPTSSPLSRSDNQVKPDPSVSPSKGPSSGSSPHHSRRPAAERAAAVITATSADMEDATNDRRRFLEQSDPDSSSADESGSESPSEDRPGS